MGHTLILWISKKLPSQNSRVFFLIFKLNFIYLFIQQVLISYLFYTY